MNFSQFCHYDFTLSPDAGTTLTNPQFTYAVYSANYSILHVAVTCMDPLRNITLLHTSCMWTSCTFSGTIKSDKWNLLDVHGGKIYPATPNYIVTLPNMTQTDLYFGISGGQGVNKLASQGNVVALNLLLFGSIGSVDYGQNLPFIALSIT